MESFGTQSLEASGSNPRKTFLISVHKIVLDRVSVLFLKANLIFKKTFSSLGPRSLFIFSIRYFLYSSFKQINRRQQTFPSVANRDSLRGRRLHGDATWRTRLNIGNESVPIQLAQCWFPGLAISNAKYKYIFK